MPALAAASSFESSVHHMRFDPNFPSFRTCGCCPTRTCGDLCLFPIDLHNLRIALSVLFGSDALRYGYSGLSGGSPAGPPILPFRHCKLPKRIVTGFVLALNVSFFSAHNPGRIDPHPLHCVLTNFRPTLPATDCCDWRAHEVQACHRLTRFRLATVSPRDLQTEEMVRKLRWCQG